MAPRQFVVGRFEPRRHAPCARIGRLVAAMLSGFLLASCTSLSALSAFGKSLNPFGSDEVADDEPIASRPEAIEPAPSEGTGGHFISFVQELMAASADLDEEETRAERAANAAAAWRGAGEEGSASDGG